MRHCEGFTRDISAGGVFVLTSDLLPVGSIVQMEIQLSPVRVRLRSHGQVMRTEPNGFGVVADTGFRMMLHEGLQGSNLKAECEDPVNLDGTLLLPN